MSDAHPPVRVDLPARRPDGTGGEDAVEGVALVTLDRVAVHNALNDELLTRLVDALRALDADDACRCIVLTGAGERAFAAGADIREMVDETPASLLARDRFARWDEIAAVRKPLIAAVRGYALGGGLELALLCDMLVAGDDARFGQPEIGIGVIPGAGGTQRLARAVGKPRAMELVLTGRQLGASEADALGLVTRVVPAAETLAAALDLAARIAAMPPLAVRAATAAVRAADELPLAEGVRFERRLFHLLFGTEDQREGMTAFLEKREPSWRGR